MTTAELKAEFEYRKAEREAILADGGTPTLSQQYTAELEARAACEVLAKQDDTLLL